MTVLRTTVLLTALSVTGITAAAEPVETGSTPSSQPRADKASPLSIQGDLAGSVTTLTTEYEDTFADIGDSHSLGFMELVQANPGIDPWLPGDGTRITLPTRYVLPDSPRQGIVINLAEFRLYYFTEQGVRTFPVGVGKSQTPSPLTETQVTMNLESPAWYPPDSIRAEYREDGTPLPRMIPPGPNNPLGPFAMKLAADGYLIHGTNKQFGVGMPVSHGCIRMYNDDIASIIYDVSKGTPVRFIDQSVKVGLSNGEVWLEVHRSGESLGESEKDRLWRSVMGRMDALLAKHPDLEFRRAAVELAIDQADGVPVMVGERVTTVATADADTETDS